MKIEEYEARPPLKAALDTAVDALDEWLRNKPRLNRVFEATESAMRWLDNETNYSRGIWDLFCKILLLLVSSFAMGSIAALVAPKFCTTYVKLLLERRRISIKRRKRNGKDLQL